MSEITKRVGQRIRNYRVRSKLSQEQLAERFRLPSDLHGQVERGEKNATLESIAKIAAALDVPLSQLFEKLEDVRPQQEEKISRWRVTKFFPQNPKWSSYSCSESCWQSKNTKGCEKAPGRAPSAFSFLACYSAKQDSSGLSCAAPWETSKCRCGAGKLQLCRRAPTAPIWLPAWTWSPTATGISAARLQ